MSKIQFKTNDKVRFMTVKYGWVYGTVTNFKDVLEVFVPRLGNGFFYPELRVVQKVK